jgi:hypothetical protein
MKAARILKKSPKSEERASTNDFFVGNLDMNYNYAIQGNKIRGKHGYYNR